METKLRNRFNLLKKDKVLRAFIQSSASVFINIAFFLYNIIIGLLYRSLWNFSISIYYLVLIILRASILLFERRWEKLSSGKKYNHRLKLFRINGFMLFALDIALIVPITLMAYYEKPVNADNISAIALASYTTYKAVIAIINYKRSRNHDNLSFYGLRIINLKEAMAAILTLQTTLVTVYGTPEKMLSFTNITNGSMLAGMLAITFLLLKRSKKLSKNCNNK